MRDFTKKLLGIAILLCLSKGMQAQKWHGKIHDSDANLKELEDRFNSYFGGGPREGGVYKEFMRWKHFNGYRFDPKSGKLIDPRQNEKAYLESVARQKNGKRSSLIWTKLGPMDHQQLPGGTGRVEFVEMSPLNPQLLYLGTQTGSFYRSTDNGNSWAEMVTNHQFLAVKEMAIAPSNSAMYLAASTDMTMNLYKSTNGGQQFSLTSLQDIGTPYKIMVIPGYEHVVFVATSRGLYRSVNWGNTWMQVLTGICRDVELRPGTPSHVYATIDNKLMKSTNYGYHWTEIHQVTDGRYGFIAVSPSSPATLYYLATQDAVGVYGNCFHSMYRSDDGGASLANLGTSVHLRNQPSLHLVFEASPDNVDQVFAGGVNLFRSDNGGNTWQSKMSSVTNTGSLIHVDFTYLDFKGSRLWACNDGGIYSSLNKGDTWYGHTSNLNIHDIYKMDVERYDDQHMLVGAQDNGTSQWINNSWTRIHGADGMDCAIDYQNPETVYYSTQHGNIYRRQEGGISGQMISSDITETDSWLAPLKMHPENPETIYVGIQNLWRSENKGEVWSKLTTFTDSKEINEIVISRKDPNYIYFIREERLYWSEDAGASWQFVTMPGWGRSLEVSPANPRHVYVGMGGNPNTGLKPIYEKLDIGSHSQPWQSLSVGLSDYLNVEIIEAERGTGGALYIGTQIGVYHYNPETSSWMYWSNGMPPVSITDIAISDHSNKIRVSTYGRGVYESGLQPLKNKAPVLDFTHSLSAGCQGMTISFENYTNNCTWWHWQFPGGTPSSYFGHTPPPVTYGTQGTYDVRLNAGNATSSAFLLKEDLIQILALHGTPITHTFEETGFDPSTGALGNGWYSEYGHWKTDSGISPGSPDIGPSGDHTGNGNYVVMRKGHTDLEDELYSPCFNLYNINDPELTFWYNMNGNYSVGSLHVDVLANDGWYEDITQEISTIATTPNGSFGDHWIKRQIDLSAFDNQFIQLRFRAENLSWSDLDIAIDDINVSANDGIIDAYFTAESNACNEGGYVRFQDASTGAYTWDWSFQGGIPATSTMQIPSIQYMNQGVYDVSLNVTGANGSDNQTRLDYILVNSGGAKKKVGEETWLESSCLVYPNPLQDQLTIEVLGKESQLLIEIVDGLGKVISHLRLGEIQEQTIQIPTDQMSTGIYYLRINNQRIKRLVKM